MRPRGGLTPFPDHRKVTRFALHMPATFGWKQGGKLNFGRGTCRDVSPKGVFVLTATVPPLNSTLKIDIWLSQVSRLSQTVRLYGKGKVIRVDESGEEKGFAAQLSLRIKRNGAEIPSRETGNETMADP